MLLGLGLDACPHVIVLPRCAFASACCICGSSSVAYVLPVHGCDSGEHAQTTSRWSNMYEPIWSGDMD